MFQRYRWHHHASAGVDQRGEHIYKSVAGDRALLVPYRSQDIEVLCTPPSASGRRVSIVTPVI